MQMDPELLGGIGPTRRQRLRQSYGFHLQAPRKDAEGVCWCCGCGCCYHQLLRCLQLNTAVWRWPCCSTPQNRSFVSRAIMASGVDKLARTDWARLGFRANRSSAASGGCSCKVRNRREEDGAFLSGRATAFRIQTQVRVKLNRGEEREEEGWIAVKLGVYRDRCEEKSLENEFRGRGQRHEAINNQYCRRYCSNGLGI